MCVREKSGLGMASPRILTFNFHEPYLCLLAQTGFAFDVGQFEKPPFAREWQTRFRPLPPNLTLVEEKVWRRELQAGKYDVVIAHNELNANDLFGCPASAILVCHNRRNFLETTVTGDKEEGKNAYEKILAKLQEQFSFVFISEAKRQSYGLEGTVILPGIDVNDYGGYMGERREILRVGNAMRARNLMFDVDFQEAVCLGLPHRVVGEDPQIPGARPSQSFEELLGYFRDLRCLLHVTCHPFEDGYNLSMLEAMACGMPVVSLANPSSPLTDGRDGLVATDVQGLRERLSRLLEDVIYAREIGAQGRETVSRAYPLQRFVQQWQEVIEKAAESGPRGRAAVAAKRIAESMASAQDSSLPRLNVLLEYYVSPITTGRYFETALRKTQNVTVAGVTVPLSTLKGWGFTGTPPFESRPDVLHGPDEPYSELMRRLGEDKKPHLLLWIDSGLAGMPTDSHALGVPRVCYIIDTHCMLSHRIEIAKHFDYTFLAQPTYMQHFVDAGVKNVAWLPLGCSPELHHIEPQERVYDVAFVGGIPEDKNDRRRKLIDAVCAHFPNHVVGRFWPEEMARIYAQSKIVINIAAARDTNMRVYEGMASGALLITDEADGLEELFNDGEHLVIYRHDEDLIPTIERFLADDETRMRIAHAGKAFVLSEHTYDVRIRLMLAMVLESLGLLGGYQGESRFNRGGYYRSPRPELARQVPKHVQRLLDVGCGGGEFGLSLKRRGVRYVAGIEVVERAWSLAKQALDDAVLGNIEHMALPFEEGTFDCIVCGDVLEHLVEPAQALRKLARMLEPEGLVVISIPNIQFWMTFEMLSNGRWHYEDAGIMDRTHLRFFCAEDVRELIRDAGLEIVRMEPLSMWSADHLPRDANGCLRLGKATIGPLTDEEYRDYLTYQFLVVAGKKGFDRLALARRAIEVGDPSFALYLAESVTDTSNVERQRVMAIAAAKMGKADLAERLLRDALSLPRAATSLHGDLGILLVALNRPEEAVTHLELVLESDPDNSRYLGGLGLAYTSLGKYAEAFAHLVRALDVDFQNAPLTMHLIAAARASNRLSDAEPIVKRFVDFFPGTKEVGYAYAELLCDLGKKDAARDALDTLLMLAPDYEPALALLAALDRREV
ncbi:MAG: glycosyltransferase [Candidatus Hydrogenedentes bacterium]|nr:glycosyltransferase [Candidatus Hydrogenedentota bacterium]